MTETIKSPVVVVGVDGSEGCAKAADWAQQYAEATGASVHLVTAFERPHAFGIPYATLEGYSPAAQAKEVADKAAAALSLPAERVQVSVKQGPPRQVLLSVAADADLLVVGSRGHTSIGGLLLGSVSAYCAHHATVPVVVVR
jgi:nucleotide-binding universal stress UspA family protein